jgi:hypothetical protein
MKFQQKVFIIMSFMTFRVGCLQNFAMQNLLAENPPPERNPGLMRTRTHAIFEKFNIKTEFKK